MLFRTPFLVSRAVLALIILPSLLTACSKVQSNEEDFPKNRLSVSIKANSTYNDHQAIPITFTIKNGTNKVVHFLRWGTPFEGRLTRNQFLVKHANNELNYQGMMIKRGKPRDKDFISIQPMQALKATLDISPAYQFSPTKKYSLSYRESYLRTLDNQGLTKIMPSNKVEFVITK